MIFESLCTMEFVLNLRAYTREKIIYTRQLALVGSCIDHATTWRGWKHVWVILQSNTHADHDTVPLSSTIHQFIIYIKSADLR